jgi:hypothetical protein
MGVYGYRHGSDGAIVTVERDLRVQLNHASAFDEFALLRSLGVLRLDLGGSRLRPPTRCAWSTTCTVR